VSETVANINMTFLSFTDETFADETFVGEFLIELIDETDLIN